MVKKISLVLLMFILVACSSSPVEPDKPDKPTPNEEPKPEAKLYSVFNGQEVKEATSQALGIMIENTPAARPHSGIGLADVVYEVAVEGWYISRFLAIFASEHPRKIGPVRSARIPFVRMVQEWDVPYAHYGAAETGQGDAKSLIAQIKPPVVFNGVANLHFEFYSRDNARKAPHNAYFDLEAATSVIPKQTYDRHFFFNTTSTVQDALNQRVFLRYSSDNRVMYEYDQSSGYYNRFINDQPMMDAYTNKQVTVKNIIVLHAPHRAVEAVAYILVDFIGEGRADFFVGGKHEMGTWKKDSYDDITRYYDVEGHEVVFLAGNTWIQVIHDQLEFGFN